MYFFSPQSHHKSSQGFTLIEFIVIISIFAIMASVALFNFNGFRSNVGQNNLAHDIALVLRQAQVFGNTTTSDASSSYQLALDSQGNPLRFAYGMNLVYPFGQQNTFTLYQKATSTPGDEVYHSGDTLIDTISIAGPQRIVAVLGSLQKDLLLISPQHMIPTGQHTLTGDLSIAFSRPRPEALFFSGNAPLSENYLGIYIAGTQDPAGTASHVIIISRTGEIDVY